MREVSRGRVVCWLQIDVRYVNDGAGRHAPSRTGRRVGRPGRLVAQTLPRAWRAAPLGREVDEFSVPAEHGHRPRLHQSCGVLGDCFEDGLYVGLRAADDTQDLASGCLSLQRLLRLGEQAHVLDGDNSLVGESLEKGNLVRGERTGLTF